MSLPFLSNPDINQKAEFDPYVNKLVCNDLQVLSGATNGDVLTSDASGNATWQASGSGVTSVTNNNGTNFSVVGNVLTGDMKQNLNTNGNPTFNTQTLTAATNQIVLPHFTINQGIIPAGSPPKQRFINFYDPTQNGVIIGTNIEFGIKNFFSVLTAGGTINLLYSDSGAIIYQDDFADATTINLPDVTSITYAGIVFKFIIALSGAGQTTQIISPTASPMYGIVDCKGTYVLASNKHTMTWNNNTVGDTITFTSSNDGIWVVNGLCTATNAVVFS